ncbi:MAG: AAA family ATPase [Chloroflexi bacterium HGW-Chloroflexi-1]|nr:MAG: AAA family ATPase [Chloroflexi bacterium HGW-Chloroflexi-1]
MQQRKITDDLEALLQILPTPIEQALRVANQGDNLLEIILDLGRVPEARFVDRELVLDPREVTDEDLNHVIAGIGQFTGDNRAGIERTLHRISCIRNRQGRVIGLTCRVGRAVYGVIDIIEDIVNSGQSILLLGKPGVGKTTLLREAARILGEKTRVIVVDTSNEIGGDGDIPHPAIGKARRMQVAAPELQHEVMIEAVENHMPQVIVIDEIGRQQEAAAARTIAERGVQLIGTAHGITLDNLLMNPTLSDLVGGIECVTLSDEEARRRGTQKSVLERRAPPTFDVLIEIQDRQRMAVHHDVAAAVDALLRGRVLVPEVRYRDETGQVRIKRAPAPPPINRGMVAGEAGRLPFEKRHNGPTLRDVPVDAQPDAQPNAQPNAQPLSAVATPGTSQAARIYPYGVGRGRLVQAAQNLGVPVAIVDSLDDAQAVVTLKNYYRKHPQPIAEAERRRIPVYVLRANTVNQMESCLGDIFGVPVEMEDPVERAIAETQEAIRRVLAGSSSEELQPASAEIRRLQHDMARGANLVSHSYGNEPRRRVRIFLG